jgi:hypothetical protein
MMSDGKVIERWESLASPANLPVAIEKVCRAHEAVAAEQRLYNGGGHYLAMAMEMANEPLWMG